jgi:WhiB family redox-sensing transcriptional regulator
MKHNYGNYSEITFEAWRENAACSEVGIDPEVFFPLTYSDKNLQRATSVCRTCDVRLQCLEHAKENHYTDGVWGGELFSRWVKK